MKARPIMEEELDVSQVVQLLSELLNDKKAENVVVIDVSKKSSFTRYMIIASGNVGRQVVAMGDHVMRFAKDHHLPAQVEGMEQGDWVLVDLGDIVVHLFRPDVRERYGLEKMWSA